MPFSEERLVLGAGFDSRVGVERRTDVTLLGSGFEARSTPWAHGRRRYTVTPGVVTRREASALIDFFEARRGRLTPFRYRDFADHAALDEPVGPGDGHTAVFQLARLYGDYRRPIRKPVDGSVTLKVEGVERRDGWSCDPATGTVTFAHPPAAGALITASFRFDTPVRFDTDALEVALESSGAVRIEPFALVEVRV